MDDLAVAYVLKEALEGETRVAATPATVKRYIKAGFEVVVQAGAGDLSFFADAEYAKAGATIDTDGSKVASADVVMQVAVPTVEQVDRLRDGSALVSYLWAYEHLDVVQKLVDKKIGAFSMDAIPRITRAQKDDARSSQANIAGYKAVLMAADHLPRVMPMLMTAAGTIKPAKVVIIGAGVAGLQAIATARRLGAVVEVSDVRPAVEEQVKSLGATYIKVETDEDLADAGGYAKEQSDDFKKLQQQTLEKHLIAADIIICTALIPYRDAPVIVNAGVVEQMRAGSVIVDLAAERGGNCELTEAGKVVSKHNVTLVGTLNVNSLVPVHSSDMYSNNVRNVLLDFIKEGVFAWDLEDDIVQGALITHDGQVRDERVKEALSASGSDA